MLALTVYGFDSGVVPSDFKSQRMMMRILLTGGAGFIGSNMVRYLLGEAVGETGLQIERLVTLDKLTYAGHRASLGRAAKGARHIFVEGDIGDSALVGALLREHEIDAILHLASESHVDRSIENPEAFIMTNLVGTYRLLEAFRQYLAESKPRTESRRRVFLHVSTDEVHGSLGAGEPPFSATTPMSPNSPYSATKAGSEHLVRAYQHTYGLPVIITRCSNNYGPRQFPEKLIPLMIGKTLTGGPLPVYGDGGNVRDWLYVEDHCRGLALALAQGQLGEIYMLGGRCELSNLEVVHAIIETLRELAPDRVSKTAAELIGFVRDRPGHDRRYAVDSSRIENELGWRRQENFATGMRKTVQWYLEHETWLRASEGGC